MERYAHRENETIRCSNLMWGLMSWFYNNGHHKTCKRDEALFADQRVFGPAAARGLLAMDGTIWYITEEGVAWVKSFLSRNAWKDNASRNFSHYIKVQRTRLQIVSRRTAQSETRTRAKAANA